MRGGNVRRMSDDFAGAGHPDVDRVLASLDATLDLPIAAQVGVFESAVADLRAALAESSA